MDDLEKAYNKKINTNENIDLKFGLVLFLEDINKNPGKKIFAQYFEYEYNVNPENLRKKALEEGYLELGSPILNVQSSTVSEIKEVLKKRKLKVSGRKQELIDRIQENLTDEEIKEEFPGTSYSLTEEGKDFIIKNEHVPFYNKMLKNYLDISREEYDTIFKETSDKYDSALILIKKLMEKYVKKGDWGLYRNAFQLESTVYEDLNDDEKILESYLKVFICDINIWGNNNSCYLYNISLNPYFSKKINSLLAKLSLSMDKLKNMYDSSCKDVEIPLHTTPEEESFKYLIRQFNGEDPEELTIEIRKRYKIDDGEFFQYSIDLYDKKIDAKEIGTKIRSKFQ